MSIHIWRGIEVIRQRGCGHFPRRWIDRQVFAMDTYPLVDWLKDSSSIPSCIRPRTEIRNSTQLLIIKQSPEIKCLENILLTQRTGYRLTNWFPEDMKCLGSQVTYCHCLQGFAIWVPVYFFPLLQIPETQPKASEGAQWPNVVLTENNRSPNFSSNTSPMKRLRYRYSIIYRNFEAPKSLRLSDWECTYLQFYSKMNYEPISSGGRGTLGSRSGLPSTELNLPWLKVSWSMSPRIRSAQSLSLFTCAMHINNHIELHDGSRQWDWFLRKWLHCWLDLLVKTDFNHKPWIQCPLEEARWTEPNLLLFNESKMDSVEAPAPFLSVKISQFLLQVVIAMWFKHKKEGELSLMS